MEEVLSKTSAFPTDATIIAMIDALIRVVIPQLANVAVIPSGSFTTPYTEFSSSLSTTTNHAEHILGVLTNKNMIFCFIMAQPTSIPSVAGGTLKFDISFIVFTAQRWQDGLVFDDCIPVLVNLGWI